MFDRARNAGYQSLVAQKEKFVSGGPDGTGPTSLSRDVDRLVHKFRTPLNSLSLNADLLGSVSVPKPGKEALHARALKSLQTEVGRLDRIAGDFQRYVGASQVKPLNMSISELLTNAMAEAGDGPKVEILAPKSPPMVEGDPRFLALALAELVKNAREAGGENGTAPKLEVKTAGDEVHIDVTDAGGGIELDPPDRAFELFFSVKQGHLGFGLTFARRIARAHDGDVTIVKSGKDGTTMRLSVPAKK